MRLHLAVPFLVAACGPSIPTAPPVPHDPALGHVLLVDSPMRNHFYLLNEGVDAAVVLVWRGPGQGLDLRDVGAEHAMFVVPYDDPGAARAHDVPFALPAPRQFSGGLPPSDDFHLGVSLMDHGLVLGTRDGTASHAWTVHVFDGDGWHAIPAPEGTRVTFVAAIVARGPDAVVVAARGAFGNDDDMSHHRWDGALWQRLERPASTGGAHLGPWDDAGLRMVYADDAAGVFWGEALCTDLWPNGQTTLAGAPACIALKGRVPQPALNGTTSDFVFLADTSANDVNQQLGLLRYRDGEIVPIRGVPSGSTLVSSPHGARVVVTPHFVVDDGELGVLPGLLDDVEVTCDVPRQEDPTSDCVPRELFAGRWGLGAGGSVLTEVRGDTVDGERRILVLPRDITGELEARDPDVTSELPPPIDQVGGAQRTVNVHLPDGVALADLEVAVVAVDAEDEEHSSWEIVGEAVVVTGPPGSAHVLSLRGDDLDPPVTPRDETVTLPVTHADSHVGRTWAVRGVPVLDPFEPHGLWAAAPAGGAVLLQDDTPRWVVVHHPPGADRPRVTPLAAVDPNSEDATLWTHLSPRFAPDGRHAVFFHSDGLEIVDALAAAPLGRVELGASFGSAPMVDAVAYAWAAPCLVAPTATRAAGGSSGASVWCWGSGTPVEARTRATSGRSEALSPDGLHMARVEGAQTVVVDLATGDSRVSALPVPVAMGDAYDGRYLWSDDHLAVLQRRGSWTTAPLHVEVGDHAIEVAADAKDAAWVGGLLYFIEASGDDRTLRVWDPSDGLAHDVEGDVDPSGPLIVAGARLVVGDRGNVAAAIVDNGEVVATHDIEVPNPSAEVWPLDFASGPWGGLISDPCRHDGPCDAIVIDADGEVEVFDRRDATPFGAELTFVADFPRGVAGGQRTIEVDGLAGSYQAVREDQIGQALLEIHDAHKGAAGVRAPCLLYVFDTGVVCAW